MGQRLSIDDLEAPTLGQRMHDLAGRLFPICRSITGDGVRETLDIIAGDLPDLVVHEVPSGTEAFDWVVPEEWNVRDAYIVGPEGNKVADFQENNLHLVGYSVPIDRTVPLSELQTHLHSDPEQPDAIPYATSYYEKRWGFCISHNARSELGDGDYRVKIDSTLEPGHLTYAELVVPGTLDQEVLLSTYVCHPSMANNELSGPVVATHLAQWIGARSRKYTYRLVFVPETIGAIVFISRNLDHLQKRVVAGYNLSCLGDERTYSYVPTRRGDTLSDRVALHVLRHIYPAFDHYSFLDRGSDERQYNSPGVDLPVAVVARSKYREYPEYHTSNDDLSFVTPDGLYGGYTALRLCLACLEENTAVRGTVQCEPQMGKRGLYNTLSRKGDYKERRTMMDILGYADGRDLLEIAEIVGEPIWDLAAKVARLEQKGLVTRR